MIKNVKAEFTKKKEDKHSLATLYPTSSRKLKKWTARDLAKFELFPLM